MVSERTEHRAAILAGLTGVVMFGYMMIYEKNKPSPLPLESNAIDARKYGINYYNEDKDRNGAIESYFRDPNTGIEYKVTKNGAQELTLTQVGK